jgi:hypothetical protein
MAYMPKTPRRSIRSYMRSAPLTVIPFRDTEILAELECQRPVPHPSYRMGSPRPTPKPIPPPKPPGFWARAVDVLVRAFWVLFIGGYLAIVGALTLTGVVQRLMGWA